jgi:hypothetical protein
VDQSRLSRPRRTLGALQSVRDQEVEGSSRALVAALEALRNATRAVDQAEEVLAGHAQAMTASKEAHRRALEGGSALAGELAGDATWEKGASLEHDTLAARVADARKIEARAIESVDRARVGLAERRAAARVVEEAVSRLDAADRRSLESRAEEAAAEAWRPRR